MNPNDNAIPTAAGVAGIVIALLVFLAMLLVALVVVISAWKIFVKAGRPGWAAIVPVYGGMVLAEIGGKPGWWGLLCLVPGANLVFGIMILMAVAERFGKSAGFGLGLLFLSPVFFPILAFGDARYLGLGPLPIAGLAPPVLPPQPE